MNKIKSILFGLLAKAKRIKTKDWITYGLILILLILLFAKCGKGGSNTKTETTSTITSEIPDSLLETIVIEQVETVDSSPKGDTIYLPGKTVYRESKVSIQTAIERDEIKAKYNRLVAKYTNAVSMLDSLTDEQIKDGGGSEVWTFVETEELPIVETDKSEKGENYEIEETIRSRGELEYFKRKITVHPKVVTITKTETVTEYKKKNNFLALKFGMSNVCQKQQRYYMPSIEYGWKFLLLEVGMPLDRDYKYLSGNFQVSTGVFVKF
jgi:hypothetical protein